MKGRGPGSAAEAVRKMTFLGNQGGRFDARREKRYNVSSDIRPKGVLTMARTKKTPKISVLNWMGTLLLCAVPGVNLIAVICFMIFAKSPSKKTFAAAMLIWMLIAAAAAVTLLAVFPTEAAELAQTMRELAAASPAPTIAP